jgi:hypothetical protein
MIDLRLFLDRKYGIWYRFYVPCHTSQKLIGVIGFGRTLVSVGDIFFILSIESGDYNGKFPSLLVRLWESKIEIKNVVQESGTDQHFGPICVTSTNTSTGGHSGFRAIRAP